MQWLRYSWLPLVLLACLAAQYLSLFDFLSLLTPRLPAVLLGISLALGVFFKSSRIAFSAALLLAAYLSADIAPWLHRGQWFSLALGLAACNLALITFSRDRSLLSVFGLLLVLAVSAQVGGLYALQICCEQAVFGTAVDLPLHGGETPLAPADLLITAAILLTLLKSIFRLEPTGFGLLLCILLLAAADRFGLPLQLAAAAAGLLLSLLVLRSAYELAFRDELTGIPSRRAYSRYLLTLGRHFCIAVVDIDHFKKLNDRHGHQVGDQALRMVAGRIARFGGGRAFRYGGEEFVVVFRGRDRDRALQSLEQMREKIAGYPLRLRGSSRDRANSAGARSRRGQGGGRAIKSTVSVGIASSGGQLKTPDQVLRAADSALYRAKRGGRNRVDINQLPLKMAPYSRITLVNLPPGPDTAKRGRKGITEGEGACDYSAIPSEFSPIPTGSGRPYAPTATHSSRYSSVMCRFWH